MQPDYSIPRSAQKLCSDGVICRVIRFIHPLKFNVIRFLNDTQPVWIDCIFGTQMWYQVGLDYVLKDKKSSSYLEFQICENFAASVQIHSCAEIHYFLFLDLEFTGMTWRTMEQQEMLISSGFPRACVSLIVVWIFIDCLHHFKIMLLLLLLLLSMAKKTTQSCSDHHHHHPLFRNLQTSQVGNPRILQSFCRTLNEKASKNAQFWVWTFWDDSRAIN